jgi:hypothetical protein
MEKLAGLDPASKNNRDAKKVDEKGNSINSQQRHLYRNIDGSERLGGAFRDAFHQARGGIGNEDYGKQDIKNQVDNKTRDQALEQNRKTNDAVTTKTGDATLGSKNDYASIKQQEEIEAAKQLAALSKSTTKMEGDARDLFDKQKNSGLDML